MREVAGALAEAEVIIAGAGPVGLALAMELGSRGVRCVIVEARDRGRLVPRAKLANVRTMEHMRRWGIASRLREATPLPPEFSTDIAFVTSVLGHEITRFEHVFFTGSERDDRFSERALQIPQYVLEPVLRRAIEDLATVTFLDGWRVEELVQTGEAVSVAIRPSGGGEAQRIAGRYLVGCDGAGSAVRRSLGIEMRGDRALARNLGVVFRAPQLAGLLRVAPALHLWTVNAATPSYMGPADRHGLWWLQATAIDPSIDLEAIDPAEVVYGALGERIPIQIVNVDPWLAHAVTAERVRDGRVFLAGDAAHQHSPMGAHGMNAGIGDAVDLGWKLAAVLQGWADERILDSYAAERAPLHARVTAEATHNYGALANHFVRDGLEDPGPAGAALRAAVAEDIQRHKRREFYSLGLVLGHVYEHSPIVMYGADPGTPPPAEVDEFTPLAYPGRRIPHAWLPDGASLFDRLGAGLTLLVLGHDASTRPLEQAARRRGIPLDVVRVSGLAEHFPSRLALVRPDQILAWQGDRVEDADALLGAITGSTAEIPR